MISAKSKAKAEYYKRSYYEFFKDFWHTVVNDPLIENWHIEYLCAELQKVGQQIINKKPKEYDLIINISPGESKSTIATVLFPCWLWTVAPHLRIISASYSASLSTEHATLSRDCINSELYQRLFGDIVTMRKDTEAKTFYKNEAKGFRKAVSTGSAVTGSHADLILIDDPLSPKQASSKAYIDGANDFINKTLASRKTDKLNTPTIMIMQRLNDDDPTGNWLKQVEESGRAIKHICLPATNDYPIKPIELSAKYENGIMNPLRTGEKVLKEQKTMLGSLGFAGQFGQQPAPLQGNIVKREYLPITKTMPPPPFTVNFSIDTAYTEKEQNDPTGIMAYFMFMNTMWVLHYEDVRMEFPELINRLRVLFAKYADNKSRIYIEKKASGASVIQQLRRDTEWNVIPVVPKGSKMNRLVAHSAKLESLRVVLIEGAWNEGFILSLMQFPNAKHDEPIDCLTQAMDKEFNSNGTIQDPVVGGYNKY